MARPSYFARLIPGPRSVGGPAPLTPPRLRFRETPSPADFTVSDAPGQPVGRSASLSRSQPPEAPEPAPQPGIATRGAGARAADPISAPTPPVTAVAPPPGAAAVDHALLAPGPNERAAARTRARKLRLPQPLAGPPDVPVLELRAPGKAAEADRPAMAPQPRWDTGAQASRDPKLWIGALEVKVTQPAPPQPRQPAPPATPRRGVRPAGSEQIARPFAAFGLRQS